VANPTSCLGDQVWRPTLAVGLVQIRCPARYEALLYIVQGGFLVGYKAGVLVGLHGTSPSRITREFQ
jgi:hypothetical protein